MTKEESAISRRPSIERSHKQKLILAFADTYTIDDIARSIGCSTNYVRYVIKKAGITPMTKKHKRKIVQLSADGRIINRYPSCLAAAKAIGKLNGSAHIWACVRGKVGNKTAYGFRWAEEVTRGEWEKAAHAYNESERERVNRQ